LSRTDTLKINLNKIKRVEDTEQRLTILDNPGIEAKPLSIRKAMALNLYLSYVPIHIYPEELIVGMPFRERPDPLDPSTRILPPRSASGQIYLDAGNSLIEKGFTDETYHPVLESLKTYGGSTKYALFPHYATEQERAEALRYGLDESCHPGHQQAGHHRIIKYGWSGLQEIANKQFESLDHSNSNIKQQKAFLKSVILSLEAAKKLAIRYSELAAKLALTEKNLRRKKELQQISKVCMLNTEREPKSWWEALQIHWFSHMISHAQGAHQAGRFDQYMWPPLRQELEKGTIKIEEAQELLECLWIKYSSYTDYTSDNLQNIILGGVTPEGNDATNQLSYMCLKAIDHLDLIDPKWNIRVHRKSPDKFLLQAAKLIKKNKSMPGIYNDEIIIEALLNAGIPLHDARDYTNDGCSELLVQGRTNPWAFEGKVKLLKCLEKATWKLSEYSDYEELFEVVKQEISIAVAMAVSSVNILQRAAPKISPNPWLSASVESCLDNLLDLTMGGATYNNATINVSGVADTSDSLAAVKKLVYEENQITPFELQRALQSNYKGYELMRQQLLNRAPKFGNDDDYVDEIAKVLVDYIAAEITKHTNPLGGKYNLGLFSYGEYISHGMVTRATPDGRKAGESISPNFSPAPGRDRKGPYAVMKSTTKVDQSLMANGNALDITLHPTALMGSEGIEKLVSLLKAFNRLGGIQVQFNIIDRETLVAAQKTPEKYENLTVRLWGLPAYFIRLPKEFQDHLIKRTEHIF
jgi:formate C-acetyltransferase